MAEYGRMVAGHACGRRREAGVPPTHEHIRTAGDCKRLAARSPMQYDGGPMEGLPCCGKPPACGGGRKWRLVGRIANPSVVRKDFRRLEDFRSLRMRKSVGDVIWRVAGRIGDPSYN
jgi:hypothetical protein